MERRDWTLLPSTLHVLQRCCRCSFSLNKNFLREKLSREQSMDGDDDGDNDEELIQNEVFVGNDDENLDEKHVKSVKNVKKLKIWTKNLVKMCKKLKICKIYR